MSNNAEGVKAKGITTNKRQLSRLMFFLSIVILPLIQFCIFYIYVNLDMFILAFQKYEANTDSLGFTVSFVFLNNFKIAAEFIKDSGYMITNSLIKFVFCTLVSMALSVFFSYYLYKQQAGHKFFKVILFMPQIISSVIFALLFKYIVTDVYMAIASDMNGGEFVAGLLDNPETRLGAVIFFNIWVSFGVNIMLFTGAMNGINESVVESAKLDGASMMQEFFFITFPMSFSTVKSLLILGIVGIFTDQMQLYTLFNNQAGEVSTLGYSIYLQSISSDVISTDPTMLNYSALSALGIILTLITLPVTLIIKKAMDKFGPSEV